MTGFSDRGDEVRLSFSDQPDFVADLLVGADGIDSQVRKQLWGDAPKRPHGLHLMGGFFFTDEPIGTRGVFAHDRRVQGSYTPIRHEGRNGYEWWVLERWTPDAPFTADVKEYALSKVSHFDEPLPSFIRRTDPERTHRWEIKDRPPLAQWSKGRVTLVGDASHATSPYAAYGAGMSIEDGYFLAREVAAARDDGHGERESCLAGVRGASQAALRSGHSGGLHDGEDVPPPASCPRARPRPGLRPHPIPAEEPGRRSPRAHPHAARRDRGSAGQLDRYPRLTQSGRCPLRRSAA